MIGLYAVQLPRIGWSGLVEASVGYEYAFTYFTGTVLLALVQLGGRLVLGLEDELGSGWRSMVRWYGDRGPSFWACGRPGGVLAALDRSRFDGRRCSGRGPGGAPGCRQPPRVVATAVSPARGLPLLAHRDRMRPHDHDHGEVVEHAESLRNRKRPSKGPYDPWNNQTRGEASSTHARAIPPVGKPGPETGSPAERPSRPRTHRFLWAPVRPAYGRWSTSIEPPCIRGEASP